MLRFLTAGESHGPGLTVIIEGYHRASGCRQRKWPANRPAAAGAMGGGGRAEIERDEITITGSLHEEVDGCARSSLAAQPRPRQPG